MLRLTLAVLHLLALGIGFGAIWGRARALGGALDAGALRRAFSADSWWGASAALWITTGLWRLFAGTEKDTAYYLQNHLFFTKMGALVLILVLEIWPMVTLIRWRIGAARSAARPNVPAARRIAAISYVEAALLVVMVAVAAAMARGYGAAP